MSDNYKAQNNAGTSLFISGVIASFLAGAIIWGIQALYSSSTERASNTSTNPTNTPVIFL